LRDAGRRQLQYRRRDRFCLLASHAGATRYCWGGLVVAGGVTGGASGAKTCQWRAPMRHARRAPCQLQATAHGNRQRLLLTEGFHAPGPGEQRLLLAGRPHGRVKSEKGSREDGCSQNCH